MKTEFDALLGELVSNQALLKAMGDEVTEGDKKIKAAAADSGVSAAGEMDGGDGVDDTTGHADLDGDAVEKTKGGEAMTKAFTMKLEDGTEVDAIDGTELVKSLMARAEESEGRFMIFTKSVTALLAGQTDLIKSLQGQVHTLSNMGRGRKAVVTVVDKTTTAGAAGATEEAGMKPEEFMAKALRAQSEGRLSGLDIIKSGDRIYKGVMPEDHVIAAVQATK